MNPEQLCRAACAVVLDVGRFIAEQTGKVGSEQIETKYLNNLVSYVDQTAERLLIQGLAALLPPDQTGFVAEEGSVQPQPERPWQWIIDPLDGTTNFLHQLPFFAVSVALQYRGQTQVGIVLEASRMELFYAWKGGGAWCNDRRLSVGSAQNLNECLLATGFPFCDFQFLDAYIELLRGLLPRVRGMRRCGAAALDLAYTAAGRFDGFFEQSLDAWDVAAGAFLVQEAGGRVSDFSGGDNYLFGAEILAAPPAIFEQLLPQMAVLRPQS